MMVFRDKNSYAFTDKPGSGDVFYIHDSITKFSRQNKSHFTFYMDNAGCFTTKTEYRFLMSTSQSRHGLSIFPINLNKSLETPLGWHTNKTTHILFHEPRNMPISRLKRPDFRGHLRDEIIDDIGDAYWVYLRSFHNPNGSCA